MKWILSLSAALMAAVLSANGFPQVYDAPKLKGETVTIDGKLTEKAWTLAPADRHFRDIRGEGWPLPVKNTEVKILWDDDFLYIGATLEEDNVTASITERDDIIYHDNDFEVFLDPFSDGKLYYELENNAFGTVMDLLMEKPYCEGGKYIMNWDCKGLKLAVSVDGSINDSSRADKAWYVEMAIPFDALRRDSFDVRDRRVWRINFSRVEWLKKGGPEENWVWAPTGVVDIHRPAKWGYLRFCDGSDVPELPHAKVVKNWMWEGPHPEWDDARYTAHFKKAYECGISGILFEGYDERIYRLCHEAGLEAHYWKWTMNRAEVLDTHPEWFAVNRKGESSFDKPAYVDYYRFLCPSHPEVAEYLAEDYVKCSRLKYVDGMHLDYVRFPDVVLPVSLWKNYGIEQTYEMPEYDYCYCDLCREKFKKQTGRDPLELKYPMEDQSWINFRLDGITNVVKHISEAMEKEGKPLSAAVFPGPSMARKMVRQDWGNWPLKAYFPMIYNGFYYEGPEWIGRSVAESVKAVGGKAAIYAGLMYPDIKGDDFFKALDAAYGNGASGISFFAGPDDEGLERLAEYLKEHDYQPWHNGRREQLQVIPRPAQVFFTGDGIFKYSEKSVKATVCDDTDLPESAEGYILTVTPGQVELRSRGEAGIFYAKQTLEQLRVQFKDRIPQMKIEDYPRFQYRGAHIDVSRHFFDKDVIKKQLRQFASLKLNRFHWHLTDGVAWRLAIDKYPRLTEGIPHYTKDDVREVLALADSLHVTVIPEIEMFGHSSEVLAAYPALACVNAPESSSELCIGKERTFEFLENVLSEVIDLFPSEYIHIGGDEANMKIWENCADCKERMKAEGLAEVSGLQSYGISRIEKFVNSKGRRIIGWDEILEGGLAENATVMSWRGEDGGRKAAAAGHGVIMTPGEYCYIDAYQDTKPTEPLAMGNYVPLSKVYSYDPAPWDMTGKEYVLGVQTNLWTENVETAGHLEYMLYPRVFASAEVGWSPAAGKDFASFRERAVSRCAVIRDMGYNTFDLATEAGERKEHYDTLRHKAYGCAVTYSTPYSEQYPGEGDGTLTDGISGAWHFREGWQGFLNSDVCATVDLGSRTDIREVRAGFTQWYGAWICFPVKVTFEASLDGRKFKTLGSEDWKGDLHDPRPGFHEFKWKGKAKARYIRMTASINEDKWGWLFTDEIVVN